MTYMNGRLPSTILAQIPGGRLTKEAAAAWNAMRQYIGKRHGVWIAPTGPNSSYRSYGGQVYFWDLYRSGRGNLAARPGTSNHGWGKAVDVATRLMAYYIRKYGHMFGWSWAEGKRAGEWWHFTYVGGYKAPVKKRPLKFGTEEKKHVGIVRAKRRMRKRNKNSWSGLSSQHERDFNLSVAWLRAHATSLADEKVKDKEYQSRKVTYLRDVALNRNNRGM